MVMKVDLNSDMGEGFGPWRMGDDAALLDVITSANIACGFHAGDPDVMAETMRLAAKNGVGIGAHPGFADLKGFGRRRLNIGADELGNMIAYQLGAAEGWPGAWARTSATSSCTGHWPTCVRKTRHWQKHVTARRSE